MSTTPTVTVPRKVRIVAYIVGIAYASFLMAVEAMDQALHVGAARWFVATAACAPVVVLVIGALALGHVPSVGGISLNLDKDDTSSATVTAQTADGSTVTATASDPAPAVSNATPVADVEPATSDPVEATPAPVAVTAPAAESDVAAEPESDELTPGA